jgi:hypothetical protein
MNGAVINGYKTGIILDLANSPAEVDGVWANSPAEVDGVWANYLAKVD